MILDTYFQNMIDNNRFVSTDKIVGIIGKDEINIVLKNMFGPHQRNQMNLISIIDPDSDFLDPELTEGFNDILQIKFWDIEEDIEQYKAITSEQGQEIKEFILDNDDKPFFIHCSAGISRSAGVGCAVECLLNYNGDVYSYSTGHSDIKGHWRYSPNLAVFDKIVKG